MKHVLSFPLSVFLLFVLLVTSCAAPEDPAPVSLDLALRPLALETAPGSSAPNLTVADDGRVYVSWVEPREAGGHALQFAVFDSGTGSWPLRGTVAEGEGWFVNWADVPALAVGPSGLLVAHWLSYNGAGKYAYGVRMRVSRDGGATWEAPFWLHDDAAPAEHGFVSMVPATDGSVHAVWLDGRKFAEGDKEMTLRGRVLKPDGALGPEEVLDERTCDCCPTAATALPGGGVLAVYRDRSADEIRDIYSVRYDGARWEAPRRVAEDGWHIAGCPVNGPAVDARGEAAALAWFTAAGDVPRVNVAFSADAGRTFGPPHAVDLGHPTGRVDVVMLSDGGALVSWIEGKGEGDAAGIYARRVTASGAMSEPTLVQPTTVARASGYPRMVRVGEALFFAWTEAGETRRVRTALATL